jgi:hypothetical protein
MKPLKIILTVIALLLLAYLLFFVRSAKQSLPGENFRGPGNTPKSAMPIELPPKS